jgi:hypothetical protein
MKIESKIEFEVKNPNSRITFEQTGGGSHKVWDRFISVDKEKMYHIGNVCGTCEFFFIKQSKSLDKNFNKNTLIDSLNSGSFELSEERVRELSVIIPDGKYLVLKTIIKPKIVTKFSENNYFKKEQRETWIEDFDRESLTLEEFEFNDYYRESLVDFGKIECDNKDAFFNFFIPLYNTNELDKSRVEFYKSKLLNGEMPIVLSIGVLDVKYACNFEEIEPEFGTHWCLANYIIDGHHKIKAASELGQEIGLITFVSRNESWNFIDDMVSRLTEQKKQIPANLTDGIGIDNRYIDTLKNRILKLWKRLLH